MNAIDIFFNPEIAARAFPILLRGLGMTILLGVTAIIFGTLLGLLIALVRLYGPQPFRLLAAGYTDVMRALPVLVVLILIYYALPFAGIEFGAFGCVAIGFFLNTGSYYGEILRAGIESVPSGQMEAARATGLSRGQAMAWVVLPQAVRNVLPDLISNTLEVVKLTSIASVVALPELLFQARQAQSVTYNPTPIVVAAIAYFLLLWPLVRLISRLENRAIAGRA